MTKRQRWSALGLLSAGLLIVVMDMTILMVALPNLIADIQPTATQQLWIVDVYSLIMAGLLIPMSALADRFGRRKALLFGFALFGAISALVLVASTPELVIVLRGLLGVGGAMIMPTTLSMVRSIFTDPAERTRALAIWSVVAGVGAILGPVVGGGLLEVFSWRAAFLVNVPVAIIVVCAGLIVLPESRDPNPAKWDLLSVILSIAGTLLVVRGIKDLAKHNWVEMVDWITFIGGIIILALFVWRCLTQDNPLLDVRLFTSAPFTAGILTAMIMSFALGGIMLLVVQWLQTVAGYSPIKAGFALLPMALSSMIIAPAAPALAAKLGARTVIAGGLFIAAVGMILIGLPAELSSYLHFVAPLALVGAGLGSMAIASAIIMGSTPAARAGNAAASEESMYEIGNVLGVAILGSVAASLYRSGLDTGGLPEAPAELAKESLVNALVLADELNLPRLSTSATTAFNDGLAVAAITGGMVTMLAAILVFVLVPRGFDVNTDAGH